MRLGKGAHLRIGDQDSGRGRGPGSGMLIFKTGKKRRKLQYRVSIGAVLLPDWDSENVSMRHMSWWQDRSISHYRREQAPNRWTIDELHKKS